MSKDDIYFFHNGNIMFVFEYSEAATKLHQNILVTLTKKKKKKARHSRFKYRVNKRAV